LKKIDLVVKRSPYEAIYSGAVKAYSQKRYAEAVKLLDEFIGKEPGLAEAYQIRAYCNYYLNNYQQSISDINKLFSLGEQNYYLLSLRGINYRSIGKYDLACADFKTAAENGNPDGISNFGKYCGK
jgi:tetratricopeptide (TPR) repeat protein